MGSNGANRVASQTSPMANARIRVRMEMNLAYCQCHPDQISHRLAALDAEWDIERMLQTSSAALTVGGLTLGITRNSRWLLLPLAIQGFFLQHAVQGWCPPLLLLRRLGYRTQFEIEQERYALKALRGDFANLPVNKQGRDGELVLEAVRH